MKRLVVDHTVDADSNVSGSDQFKWNVDSQGRVTHKPEFFFHHAAKTMYVRERGLWQKLGYWCDRCQVGLLLEVGRPALEGRGRSGIKRVDGGQWQTNHA